MYSVSEQFTWCRLKPNLIDLLISNHHFQCLIIYCYLSEMMQTTNILYIKVLLLKAVYSHICMALIHYLLSNLTQTQKHSWTLTEGSSVKMISVSRVDPLTSSSHGIYWKSLWHYFTFFWCNKKLLMWLILKWSMSHS